jgi:hypothetical protein
MLFSELPDGLDTHDIVSIFLNGILASGNSK